MRVAGSSDELIDDREYAVPRELMFEMWTKAEHFARWFGPHGADMPFCEIDARPGGAIRFHHRVVASGEVIAIKGLFDEVIAPSRLRFTFTFVDAADRPIAPPQVPDWPLGVHIVMTVELHATRRGTRMTVHQRIAEAAAASNPAVVRHRTLAGVGWRQTAERLVAYLEQRST
jgi:uncharacterized protein YndB with AHSA1/START domain